MDFLGLKIENNKIYPNHSNIKKVTTKAKFHWGPDQHKAFQKLQNIFFSSPFIQQSNFNKNFYNNADASAVPISAIPLQNFNDSLPSIAYFSEILRSKISCH